MSGMGASASSMSVRSSPLRLRSPGSSVNHERAHSVDRELSATAAVPETKLPALDNFRRWMLLPTSGEGPSPRSGHDVVVVNEKVSSGQKRRSRSDICVFVTHRRPFLSSRTLQLLALV